MFFEADFSGEAGVVNFNGAGGIEVNAVHLGRNANGVLGFGFSLEVGDLVQIIDSFEAGNRKGTDVANFEITVETVVEGKNFIGRVVAYQQLKGQAFIDGHDVIDAERRKSRSLGTIGQMEAHTDAAVGGGEEFFEFPVFEAGEAVLGKTFARPEPGKND